MIFSNITGFEYFRKDINGVTLRINGDLVILLFLLNVYH